MEQIVIRGIKKTFEGKNVLEDISLNVEAGEFFTLLGPSGCGKTTLLRILAGFVKPDEGTVIFGKKDVTHRPAESRGVGMVFQNYALFPHMDVYENVAYGLKVKRMSKQEIHQSVSKYLKRVRLSGYEKRKVSELSGGEQQRVALARALVIEPSVLLLDEPLCNLDAKLRDEMREEIRALQKQLGITTIFVTHDQKEALMMSDKIAVFNEGKCIQVGSPSTLYNQPHNAFVATFVGEVNLLDEASYSKLSVALGDGDKGKLIAIRPEHIKVYLEAQGVSNEFKGVIKNIQFNGQVTEYIIEVQAIPIKCVQISGIESFVDFHVEQEVWIHIPISAIKVLGD